MKGSSMKRTILFALIMAACVPGFTADTPPVANRFAATIAPAERFDVGPVLVERHGTKGSPLVLVPGLATGGWVWEDTVRRFKDSHVIYVVTLPGFDGRPAATGNALQAVSTALRELVTTRKLAKPVFIGHSMGATLSLALAEQSPDLVGGVIAIDGLPVFPGTENMGAEQRAQMADSIKARAAGMTKEAFAAQQVQYMRSIGVTDIARAEEMAKLTAKSDPLATMDYMASVLALDLRPGLAGIKAPVLVLAPYFEADASNASMSMPDKVAYYKSLMAGTPKLDVVGVPGARHFAMIDQPDAVASAIARYLKSN
jgi:pimeloyl-ACP methyl ester carboxylesterase